MFRSEFGWRRTLMLPVLFALGASTHLLFWRGFVYAAYAGSPVDARTFVDAPLTNFGIPIICGISVAFFFGRLLRAMRGRLGEGFFATGLRAGLYGMAASFCGFEAFYLLASIYLAMALHSAGVPTANMIPGAAIAWMIEFAFFGAFPIAACLPFSFVFGFLAGYPIWRESKAEHAEASA
jgi:hypothetical protein